MNRNYPPAQDRCASTTGTKHDFKGIPTKLAAHNFDDFDEFAASVAAADANMIIQNPNQMRWSIDELAFRGCRIQVGRLGSGNIAEGSAPANQSIIYLPMTKSVEYLANGNPATSNQPVILKPKQEFCFATKAEHDWCGLFIENSINCNANQFNGVPIPELADRIWYIAKCVRAAAAATKVDNLSPLSQTIAERAADVATQLLIEQSSKRRSNGPQRGRPAYTREDIVRDIRVLLHEHRASPLHLAKIAERMNISQRTLRQAFYDWYGVGPKRYFQLRQLQEVHRALKRACPDSSSVSNVLIEFNVFEFGRFASRYKAMFGELPSQTLYH
ncbi:MAG: helix-turn-helix domain-containing protein [Hyphomicrobiaceae bacterium]